MNFRIITDPQQAREYTLGIFRERLVKIDELIASTDIDFLNTFVLETAQGIFFGGKVGHLTATGIERAKRMTQEEAVWHFARGITDGAGTPARVRDFGSALRESRAGLVDAIRSIERAMPAQKGGAQ
jgi:hypothetical protein